MVDVGAGDVARIVTNLLDFAGESCLFGFECCLELEGFEAALDLVIVVRNCTVERLAQDSKDASVGVDRMNSGRDDRAEQVVRRTFANGGFDAVHALLLFEIADPRKVALVPLDRLVVVGIEVVHALGASRTVYQLVIEEVDEQRCRSATLSSDDKEVRDGSFVRVELTNVSIRPHVRLLDGLRDSRSLSESFTTNHDRTTFRLSSTRSWRSVLHASASTWRAHSSRRYRPCSTPWCDVGIPNCARPRVAPSRPEPY